MNTTEKIFSPLENSASVEPKNVGRKKTDMSAVDQLRALKEERAAALELQKIRDQESVRGKFIFHEVPGGRMEFPFRKYKGPIEKYDMIDGQIYTVTRGVATHLNTNCWYPSYTFKQDENGRPQTTIGEKVRRCSFQSLEFLE